MMIRRMVGGAVAFGVTAFIAGYVWIAYEFPLAIVVPAAVGVFVVVRPAFGSRRAWMSSIVGGFTFTGAFLFAVFLALADGAPVALPAWAAALLAAIVAGAVTGVVIARGRGARALGGYSAIGMVGGIAVTWVMRLVAPASVDVAGFAQSAYFAVVIGLVGASMGAALGAGVEHICRSWPEACDATPTLPATSSRS